MAAAAPASAGSKGVDPPGDRPGSGRGIPRRQAAQDSATHLRIEAHEHVLAKRLALTAEVQQLLGDHSVRAVAMSGTDGLVRGMEALDTGAPISVPVGEATSGPHFQRPR